MLVQFDTTPNFNPHSLNGTHWVSLEKNDVEKFMKNINPLL